MAAWIPEEVARGAESQLGAEARARMLPLNRNIYKAAEPDDRYPMPAEDEGVQGPPTAEEIEENTATAE
jgi:hypothetical protein